MKKRILINFIAPPMGLLNTFGVTNDHEDRRYWVIRHPSKNRAQRRERLRQERRNTNDRRNESGRTVS